MNVETDKINQVMINSLFELKKLVHDNKNDLISVVSIFLLGVISTAVDLVELEIPGSASLIYADVEAAAKHQGIEVIQNSQQQNGSMAYSVSNIEVDDMTTAMNYLGQELSTTLFKALHELPMPLRKPEMLLRGVESLLTHLLSQKFNHSHSVLDSFCEHVHFCLSDLERRKH